MPTYTPLPPPPPIHPSSLFASPSISALHNLIIAGPHSHDLSLGTLLRTNRSGLQQGALEAERDKGWGWLVAGGPDGSGGDLEKNPPKMKCSVTPRNITAHSCRPLVPMSTFLFLSFTPSLRSPLSTVLLCVGVILIFFLYG